MLLGSNAQLAFSFKIFSKSKIYFCISFIIITKIKMIPATTDVRSMSSRPFLLAPNYLLFFLLLLLLDPFKPFEFMQIPPKPSFSYSLLNTSKIFQSFLSFLSCPSIHYAHSFTLTPKLVTSPPLPTNFLDHKIPKKQKEKKNVIGRRQQQF